MPAPFTDPHAVTRASELFLSVGMTPIHVRREIEGFVFNRLQGAVLREAYGLGRRWGVLGPFETAELNTRGGIVDRFRLDGRSRSPTSGADIARLDKRASAADCEAAI